MLSPHHMNTHTHRHTHTHTTHKSLYVYFFMSRTVCTPHPFSLGNWDFVTIKLAIDSNQR